MARFDITELDCCTTSEHKIIKACYEWDEISGEIEEVFVSGKLS